MDRTNLLFIMSDDQGAWAMGCSGNTELKTPNLDRLAKTGIRFDNFFCVSPVCSPARASIYTGKNPSQHGIHDWLAKGHVDEEDLSPELRREFEEDNPPYEYLWPRTQLKDDKAVGYMKNHKTFTDCLADAGYECGLSGKWHLGDSATPQAGFTFWRTEAMGGDNYYYPVMLENGKMVMKKGEYVTNFLTENSLSFLKNRDKSRPFCLAVQYTAPHSPWSAACHPKKYIDMYEDCPFQSVPDLPPHPWCQGVDQSRKEWELKPHMGVRFIHAQYAPIREEWEEYRRESLRGYYAAVTAMDADIGRLLDELEAEGLRENTLIVFTSDNGSNMGHHGIFGKGNGTYPQNMYDTSVKVPGLFSCPGRIPEGKIRTELASHYDLYETILDFLEVPYAKDEKRPGTSFADILQGRSAAFRKQEEVVVFDEYGPVRMIRTKEWKYVERYPDGPDEFYDLLHDPEEYHNQIGDPRFVPIIQELKKRLSKWFEDYTDPKFDGRKEAVTGRGQLDSHHFL